MAATNLMATGAVKWFNAKKGFGFITPDLGPRDVFVHVTAIKRSGLNAIAQGQRLEFELSQYGDGRLSAHGLRPLDREQVSSTEILL